MLKVKKSLSVKPKQDLRRSYSLDKVVFDTVLLSVLTVIKTPFSYNLFIGWFLYISTALVWKLLIGQTSKVTLFFITLLVA